MAGLTETIRRRQEPPGDEELEALWSGSAALEAQAIELSLAHDEHQALRYMAMALELRRMHDALLRARWEAHESDPGGSSTSVPSGFQHRKGC